MGWLSKKNRKKRRTKRRKAIKKAFSKATSFVKKSFKTAALLPLMPFKNLMRKALKRKGIKNVPNKMKQLLPLFRKNIMDRDTFDSNDNLVDDIATIVKEVIGFFKKAKAKKAKNEKMTEGESATIPDIETAQEVEDVEEDTKIAVNEVKDKNKKQLNYLLMGGGALVLIGAIIFFVKEKK